MKDKEREILGWVGEEFGAIHPTADIWWIAGNAYHAVDYLAGKGRFYKREEDCTHLARLIKVLNQALYFATECMQGAQGKRIKMAEYNKGDSFCCEKIARALSYESLAIKETDKITGKIKVLMGGLTSLLQNAAPSIPSDTAELCAFLKTLTEQTRRDNIGTIERFSFGGAKAVA